MSELNFNCGLKTYRINECCEIVFNPTDSFFVERLFEAFDTLDKRQDEYKAELDGVTDKREVFRIARKRDEEMREIIDGCLGDGVCQSLFGTMNVYALADGLPVWTNLMLAIIDEVDTSFAAEQKKTNPRITKYTAKYKK